MDKPTLNQHRDVHGLPPITYDGLADKADIIVAERNNQAVADELNKIFEAIERLAGWCKSETLRERLNKAGLEIAEVARQTEAIYWQLHFVEFTEDEKEGSQC